MRYAALESGGNCYLYASYIHDSLQPIHIVIVKQTRNFVLLPYWIDSSVERNDVRACHLWS